MPEIAILSHEGDTTITWRSDNPDEVEDAKRRFAYFMDKGYSAFIQQSDSERGRRLMEFSASVEHAVMVPPMVGG